MTTTATFTSDPQSPSPPPNHPYIPHKVTMSEQSLTSRRPPTVSVVSSEPPRSVLSPTLYWMTGRYTGGGGKYALREISRAVAMQRYTIFQRIGSKFNTVEEIDDDIYGRLYELHKTCRDTHAPGTDCAFGRALEAYRDPPDGDYLAGVTCFHLEDNKYCVERLKDLQKELITQHRKFHRPQESTEQQTQEDRNTGLFKAVSKAGTSLGRSVVTGLSAANTWLSGTGEEQRYSRSSVSLVLNAEPSRE